MKKLLGIFLSFAMAFAVCAAAACDKGSAPELSAPTNLRLQSNVLYWDGVENATSYEVTVNGTKDETDKTQYVISDASVLAISFDYSVVAKAEGYSPSAPATGRYEPAAAPDDLTVTVRGNLVVGSEQTAKYTAIVASESSEVPTRSVVWSLASGSDYASISADGTLTAKKVTSDVEVTIVATSVADPDVSGRKTVTIQPQPTLTQDMLDRVAADAKIEWLGTMEINLYTMGLHTDLAGTLEYKTHTKMDGTDWYAEYENAVGVEQGLYIHNDNGKASNVSLSFMNEEEYYPVENDEGEQVSWQDSGYYNPFYGASLTPADFEFDNALWRWMYKGSDAHFAEKVVASANPYDFVPKNIGLEIFGGLIMGVYSESEKDRGIVGGYEAEMFLYADIGLDSEQAVDVPKITRYQETADHEPLKQAIQNMKSLESYTVDYFDIGRNAYMEGDVLTGYTEKVTGDTLLFKDFKFDRNYNKTYANDDGGYGYKQITAPAQEEEGLYNRFRSASNPQSHAISYEALRAYKGSVSEAQPGLNFSAAIFNRIVKNEADGSVTYYVDSIMNQVATQFYNSAVSDFSLYGIFATAPLSDPTFTPHVTVKNGHITSALFYYYLGIMSGVVEIRFYDFDETTITEDIEFVKRDVPASWEGFKFTSRRNDNEEITASAAFEEYFSYQGTDGKVTLEVPFFGEALGDAFGFGMWLPYRPTGERATYTVLALYYDVPVDLDYTLSSTYQTLEDWLLEEQGFERVQGGQHEYRKGRLGVHLTEGEGEDQDSLDFYVYVWMYSA